MTLPDQRANDRVAFGPGRDLIRSKDLRARLGLLVLPSEVHPEQDAAELGVTGAFLDLVLTDPLGVPGALARSERQERALGQACPLDRAAGTVLWPVLAEPLMTYQRLSKPRCGCFVSTLPTSESRIRPSWTKRNGSNRG